jgi:glycosidase
MDGRYYSFAFVAEMPKLNTNNPEVVDYFTGICKKWIAEFDIDGIRFDVGNEISHSFIKHLHRELKKVRPDIFLLGEIWTDSAPYLDGDEYDSVMNYPFMQSIGNFFLDGSLNAGDFRYRIDYCYSLYKEQVNRVLFNLLDSHDVARIINRTGSYDEFIQQMTILMTMPGSPCIYYGTEIALEGADDPYNRRPMPWKDIESGKYEHITEEVKELIALRKSEGFKGKGGLFWEESDGSRLIRYSRGEGGRYRVCINANDYDVDPVVKGDVLFAHGYEDGRLKKGGVLVTVIKEK